MNISKFLVAASLFSAVAAGANAQDTVSTAEGQIKEDVLARINDNQALSSDHLRVQVRGHDVYVYGTVDTDLERQEAVSLAKTAPNVETVFDMTGVQNAG